MPEDKNDLTQILMQKEGVSDKTRQAFELLTKIEDAKKAYLNLVWQFEDLVGGSTVVDKTSTIKKRVAAVIQPKKTKRSTLAARAAKARWAKASQKTSSAATHKLTQAGLRLADKIKAAPRVRLGKGETFSHGLIAEIVAYATKHQDNPSIAAVGDALGVYSSTLRSWVDSPPNYPPPPLPQLDHEVMDEEGLLLAREIIAAPRFGQNNALEPTLTEKLGRYIVKRRKEGVTTNDLEAAFGLGKGACQRLVGLYGGG